MSDHIKKNQQSNNTSEMNEDLEQWASEEHAADNKNISEHTGKKPKGTCEVCEKNKATAICLKCGRNVCNSHYYHIIGVCENCLSKETVEKWKKHNPDWEKMLGVDWVE